MLCIPALDSRQRGDGAAFAAPPCGFLGTIELWNYASKAPSAHPSVNMSCTQMSSAKMAGDKASGAKMSECPSRPKQKYPTCQNLSAKMSGAEMSKANLTLINLSETGEKILPSDLGEHCPPE